MAKYKVGDRVRIRQWDDMEREFGLNSWGNIECKFTFTENMKHLCGRTATIERIIDGERIRLKDFSDKSGDLDWIYSTGMLVFADEKPEFHVYDTVKHSEYGIGTVIRLDKSDVTALVDYDFYIPELQYCSGNKHWTGLDELVIIRKFEG